MTLLNFSEIFDEVFKWDQFLWEIHSTLHRIRKFLISEWRWIVEGKLDILLFHLFHVLYPPFQKRKQTYSNSVSVNKIDPRACHATAVIHLIFAEESCSHCGLTTISVSRNTYRKARIGGYLFSDQFSFDQINLPSSFAYLLTSATSWNFDVCLSLRRDIMRMFSFFCGGGGGRRVLNMIFAPFSDVNGRSNLFQLFGFEVPNWVLTRAYIHGGRQNSKK